MLRRLSNLQVLVTRPLAQSQRLCDLVTSEGGVTWALPTIEIVPFEDLTSLQQAITQIDCYDFVIFITANAVNISAPFWARAADITTIAMGEATARAMQNQQISVDIIPEHYSSEGLLALPQLQDLSGKRILMLMGESGRQLLVQQLTENGAVVDQVELYHRECPPISAELVEPFWQSPHPKIMICTSVFCLENLLRIAGEQIYQIPLLVVSERIKNAAIALGAFDTILVTQQVSDQAILDRLIAWYAKHCN